MVEDYSNFVKVIKDIKPFMVKFKEDGIIKSKIYLNNYTIKSLIWQLIIVIFIISVCFLQIVMFHRHGQKKRTHIWDQKDMAKKSWL